MELKEKLKKTLESEYGIKNDADLIEALEEMQCIDLGIFVSEGQKGVKSA